MIKYIKWFFSPSVKLYEEDNTVYDKIVELEQRIKYLEQENIETTNVLYEIMNSLDNHRENLYNMKTQFGD